MNKFLATIFLALFFSENIMADSGSVPSRTFDNSKPAESIQPVISRTAVPRGVVQNNVVPITFNSNIDDDATDDDNADINKTDSNIIKPVDSVARTAVPSRSGVSRSASANGSRDTLESTVNTVGRSARTEKASINNTAAARRAGVTLRPSTAEVGGRAVISGTDGVQTGSNFGKSRNVQGRAATTTETISQAKERLEQTAGLNKSCQDQYNDCMDQFCAVIDANQKRCSCSPNLSRYTKTEKAVKDANSQLNDVAQRIRYVGLSADEIRAIMSATEAENALTGTKDNTESRNMLDQIEKLIKNPTDATSYSADNSSGLDMNLDFSSDASDLFNLDFLGNASSSFSNLRGTDLYNAAKKRCSTVLSQCKSAGGTPQQITGNYDLAIDKDCIAYEKGLVKMNDTLLSNVRSANQMLQKARLAVLQNKNQFDAKGCIGALNTCMTDDMVCGADYSKCLDPTKKYIDENGTVILGRRISDITDFMTNYNNSKIDKTFLMSAKNANLDTCATTGNDGSCIVRYLLQKIGTGKTVKDGGLCRAVLDKCQLVSYDSNGVYNEYNEVVVNYVQRAMVNIKASQETIISNYASTCMMDIASCYNQQVSQVNAWSSAASTNSVYNVMRGACRNIALTCAYAVFAGNTTACPVASSGQNTCIDSVSEMFYQSLLCPDNSVYQTTGGVAGENGYVNDRCKCNGGYVPWSRTCTRACGPGTIRNQTTGLCDDCPAGTYSASGKEIGTCDVCPANKYCPRGSSIPTSCPSGTSVAGSKEASDCK